VVLFEPEISAIFDEPPWEPPAVVTQTFLIVTFAALTVISPVILRFWITCPAVVALMEPEEVSEEQAEVAPTLL
jgi:hypothetical protein